LIVVDTSVWIDHFRQSDPELVAVLQAGEVLIHPFVIGELACGNLGNRANILALLSALPAAPVATHDEALDLIDARGLMGHGIGYLDVHLLASVMLAGSATLWTRDRRLSTAAAQALVACKET
jgi:predicted nucleic acid-binding protein